MNIFLKYLVAFSTLLLGFFSAYGQAVDTLAALPGKGLIVNSDTIFVNKTSVKEAMDILGIKEKPKLAYGVWDGANLDTGKDTSGTFVSRTLNFKGVTFEYEGENEADLQLQWITVPFSTNYYAFVNDNLYLGKEDPNFEKYFSPETEYDYISKDSLTYNFYSSGISFELDSTQNTTKLSEISVHYIINDQ